MIESEEIMSEKKQYAFISYSHKDEKVARRLQRWLEGYRLPTTVHNEFVDSKYLRPVFRDATDLNGGILGDEIRRELEGSKYLIVICSPHSMRSQWVCMEVRDFIDMGRLEYIVPYIVGSSSDAEDEECFPAALKDYFAAHPDREILGINEVKSGRRMAFIQLVSRMLGIDFSVLWNRYRRERIRNIAIASGAAVLVASAMYVFAVPVALSVQLVDDEHSLPLPEEASLRIGGSEYPLSGPGISVTASDIPGHFRGGKIDVSFNAVYYKQIDTSLRIGFGTVSRRKIELKRDDGFAVFAGEVMDDEGKGISGVSVEIDGRRTETDSDGRFRIEFPVSEQSVTKPVRLEKEGYVTVSREDESPGRNIRYIMRKDG